MSQQPVQYDIDDDKSVDQNVADFIGVLENLDKSLAAELASHLTAMSNGMHINNAGLLSALYAKTAPLPSKAPADGVDADTVGEEDGQ